MASFEELLDVLYEDNHLLAVNKPSGWPTTHYDGTEETVDRLAKSYLKEKYSKPGNVFLGIVHRLDKPVSGCLLFARTSKAASRISEQFREGAVEKVYWAVTEKGDWPDTGVLDDWLLHDDAEKRVKVVPEGTDKAQHARLRVQVRSRTGKFTLLELSPQSGRKHQLRVQLAHRGSPIYGDRKYGSQFTFGHAIALHARSLTVLHPTTGNPLSLSAPIPRQWRGIFAELLHKLD